MKTSVNDPMTLLQKETPNNGVTVSDLAQPTKAEAGDKNRHGIMKLLKYLYCRNEINL